MIRMRSKKRRNQHNKENSDMEATGKYTKEGQKQVGKNRVLKILKTWESPNDGQR